MSKIRKKIWPAVLAGVCLLAAVLVSGCSGSKSGQSGYLDAKNGVAVVSEYVALDGVETAISHGSGFFIGETGKDPQYLITNYHVIADYLHFGAGQNATFMDEDGISYALKSYVRVYFDSDDYVEAYVEDYNAVADVAILRLEAPTDKRKPLAICSPTEDMVGSAVYAIGFPGISDNPTVDAVSSWGLADMTLTSGIISRLTTTSGTGVQSIQIDVAINHGNSGGPLVNESGSAVGINAWKLTKEYVDYQEEDGIVYAISTDEEKAYYAVNINEVTRLLNLHGIPYAEEGKAAGANGKIVWAVIAGVVVLIAVILVIAFLAAGKKNSGKKKQETFMGQAAGDSRGQNGSASGNAGGQNGPMPGNTGGSNGSPSGEAQDSGYRLQGVSGALAGRRFMIRKGDSLILGRDPAQCNVAFPAATAGVSGKHCQVWYDNGRIYLKDLGSSHGTYLKSGARMAAGQPMELKAGEAFWLGSSEQTMVLAQKGGNANA